MAITADAVKELRERTGAGMMDCKRALEETDGDLDKAIALLRERGVASAAEEGRPRRPRGRRRQLHPHGRPHRRPDRGQLRDGLRRADRPVPEARQATSRCRSSALHAEYPSIDAIPADVLEAKQAALLADDVGAGQARGRPREDRRGPAQEVVPAGRADRAAVPRHRADRGRADHRSRSRRSARTSGCAGSPGSRSGRSCDRAEVADPATARGRTAPAESRPGYRRILLKLSGEALLGERQYGVDPAFCAFIARQVAEVHATRRADRHRRRRRQHLPRAGGGGARHGPGDRRLHRHAGDRDERPRPAGRDRADRDARCGS